MNHAELKKLAEAAKDRQLGTLTIPVNVILGLLAEIEQLEFELSVEHSREGST